MEKRALLAVFLSLLVLFIWSAIVPSPKSYKPAPENSQLFENNVVKEKQPTRVETKSIAPQAPALPAIPETRHVLRSEKLNLEFSNIGGVLKSAMVLPFNDSIPITDVLSVKGFDKAGFQLERSRPEEVVYSAAINGARVVKKYSLVGESLLRAEIAITNTAEMSNLELGPVEGMSIDMSRLDNSNQDRYNTTLYEYSVAMPGNIFRKHNALKFSSKEQRAGPEEVKWLGFRNRYYCAIVKPDFKAQGYSVDPVSEYLLKLNLNTDTMQIPPGNTATSHFLIYIGAQDLAQLKRLKLGFEDILIYSSFGLVDGIAKLIYWTMYWLHKIIPNWAVCIIIISFLVYGATYPLTIRGMASMKKMQALQPEMAALREKYKSNPQKLNQEVVGLYRKHKINPFGGCFLFLLQMPVFIGLYQVLWRSIVFKGSGFLWIKDLSEPDRLLVFPFSLPVIGNELNILPIIMAVVMFFQQKISSRSMVVTDPTQATQQKIMTIFLPIFLGFLFYKFASGLTLYFTMFYLLSTITQLKLMKAR